MKYIQNNIYYKESHYLLEIIEIANRHNYYVFFKNLIKNQYIIQRNILFLKINLSFFILFIQSTFYFSWVKKILRKIIFFLMFLIFLWVIIVSHETYIRRNLDQN